VDEMASMAGVSPETIRARCADGTIPAVNLGTPRRAVWRCRRDTFLTWLTGRSHADALQPAPSTPERQTLHLPECSPIAHLLEFTKLQQISNGHARLPLAARTQ
ncbi:MAG: helix-turn-helix domain-containing protein, partial [Planctomycetales bacterium]|nr:helix-turn-helix domain-containing protein [Planctomycetales bacterium]